jgi:hypothetical protein
MTDPVRLDLTELRAMWAARRRAARDTLRRIDPAGMRCPARSPEEREWLERHGGTPFTEDEASAALAAAYYARKYQRPPDTSDDPAHPNVEG